MAMQAIKHFRTRELATALSTPTASAPRLWNPFLPRLNPDTGRWAPPAYSRRRQAELVKKARASGTLHLLPPGPMVGVNASAAARSAHAEILQNDNKEKREEETDWTRPVEWEGEVKVKAVKGADIGNRLYGGRKRMFKGHKWQRTQERRENQRKMLMKGMKERITRFKSVYKRRRPSPLSKPRTSSKSAKLPF